MPDGLKALGQVYVLGVPVPVILMAITLLPGHVVITHTRFGREVYGVGGNEEAARLSGVNVKRLKSRVHALSGTLAALAGIALMARVNSGQPKGGEGCELDIVTVVVLGGASILGGVGRLTGVPAGVPIMEVLANGMILLDIDGYVQWAAARPSSSRPVALAATVPLRLRASGLGKRPVPGRWHRVTGDDETSLDVVRRPPPLRLRHFRRWRGGQTRWLDHVQDGPRFGRPGARTRTHATLSKRKL